MERKTIFILLAESYVIYWWLCMWYARAKARAKREADEIKFGPWDTAYKKSVWAGSGPQQATAEALRAVGHRNPQAVLKVWNDTYNDLVNKKGVRTYTAGVKASAAAREAANK